MIRKTTKPSRKQVMDKMAEAMTHMCLTLQMACGCKGCGLDEFCIRSGVQNKDICGEAYFWELAAKRAAESGACLLEGEDFTFGTITPDGDKRRKDRAVIVFCEPDEEEIR